MPLQGSVSIRVNQKVTLENLQSIVARIAGMTGCQHCGLLGVEIRLSGDPVESEQLTNLPGVKNVSFGSFGAL